MSQIKKIIIFILLCFTIFVSSLFQIPRVKAADFFSFVLLSEYSSTANIGNEFYIIALTSNGKLPSWKSSNSKIASVNTYGKITAKKAGTTMITAKIRNAEASCRVKVNKTKISISKKSASMEHGEILQLFAVTSNNSQVSWKSNRRSIAVIDDNGFVTAMKPGEAVISASADGSKVTCKLTVKSPTISLSKTQIVLYRGQSAKIDANISSGISPAWKTNRKNIAQVDDAGKVTAIKHGTAIITATVDKVSKSCEVIVEKPEISLSATELTIKAGHTAVIEANVSSCNPCRWSSSNSSIVTVDKYGNVTALHKGKAYIYAKEDGTKARCIIHVTK
jgi:uncharacterized protein YjdB